MEFTLNNAIFCGFCGNKAVISQGKRARLFNYYSDLCHVLMDKHMVEVILLCQVDDDNEIWIKKVLR